MNQNDEEPIDLSGLEDFLMQDSGLSQDTPLLITATTSFIGVPQVYKELQTRFGKMGVDWTVDLRSRGTNRHGRTVETFRLSLATGSKLDFHFDVTNFVKN